jgi:YegS/Rv2252/BmrU family lipid kinase
VITEQWYFVINPISGNGNGLALWEKLIIQLKNAQIPFSFGVSNYHQHTIALVKEKHSLGIRKFIGIGGDGTINEIINAVFDHTKETTPSIVGLLPVGTGNDWIKNQEKLTLNNIITRIKESNHSPHDIGLVKSNSPTLQHYFINVAGTGIDGRVVQELESVAISERKGKLSYFKSLLTALFNFKAPKGTVTIGTKTLPEKEILVLTASKGCYFGSGMYISPKAKADNGTLDITLATNESNWVVFPQLHRLFNGKIEDVTFIEKHITQSVKIQTNSPIPVQADGEFIGESTHITFSVFKHAVLVLA